METIGLYLAKSAALMGLFLGAYHLLLTRETFFRSNRWYLLLGMATSLVLPLVTFKKVVWIDESPKVLQRLDPAEFSMASETALSEVDNFIALPVAQHEPEISWIPVLVGLYALVALALAIQFARDFLALRRLLKGKTVQKRSGYKFVDVPENVAPFSYFSYIVYNSKMFSHDELINILEHEKVHSCQKHTLDVLVSRIVCIVFWWNPIAWLYKKAIVQNLEFIADSEAAKKIPDLKAYQITLLKITTHENCVSITNHFFQSLIKKRIVMLNKNQSSKWNSCKYLLIVPALAAFVICFQVKVVAQHRNHDFVFVQGAQDGVEVVVDKNTSDAELKKHAEDLKQKGIKLKFSKVKRNAAGEIVAIKAEYKDENGKKGSTMIAGDKPIEPIRFYKNQQSVGFGAPSHEKFRFAREMRNHKGEGPRHFAFSMGNGDDDDSEVTVIANGFEPDSLQIPKVIVKGMKKGKQKVIVDGKVVSEIDVDDFEDFDPSECRVIRTGPGASVIVNGQKVFDEEDIAKIAESSLRQAQEALEDMEWDAKGDFKKDLDKHFQMRLGRRSEAERRMTDAEMAKMKAELSKAQAEIERTKAEISKMQAELKRDRAALKKEQNAPKQKK